MSVGRGSSASKSDQASGCARSLIALLSFRSDLDEARELDLGLGHFLRPDGDLLAVLPLQHQAGNQALAVFDRVGERIFLAVKLDAADGAFPVGLLERIDELVRLR